MWSYLGSIGHEFVQKIVVKKTAKRTGEDEQSGTESFELFSWQMKKIRSQKENKKFLYSENGLV